MFIVRLLQCKFDYEKEFINFDCDFVIMKKKT